MLKSKGEHWKTCWKLPMRSMTIQRTDRPLKPGKKPRRENNMQLTLNIDMTPENLEKLKVFCEDTKAAPDKKPAAKTAVHKADKPKTGVTEQKGTTEEPKAPETK